MNTPRSVFKNTVALFVARMGSMVGSILLVFLLSRALRAEGLGIYSTAMALFGLAELACELGLSNFVPRELAKDLTQTNRYLMHAGALVLATTTIAAIGLIAATPFLGYSTETVLCIYVIMAGLTPTVLRTLTNAIFLSHQRVEFEAFSTLFWTTVRILVSVYLLSLGFGVVILIVAFTVTSYCSLFTSFFFYIRYVDKPRWEFDSAFLRHTLVQMKTFVLLAIAGGIFSQAETVVLSLVVAKSETQVGIYTAAYKLITVWYLVPQSFMGVVFPILTKAYQQSLHKSQEIRDKSIKYLLSLALPVSVGGFLIAGPIIQMFYGPGFEESVGVFRVIAWHTTLAFLNNVLWRVLLASGQQNLALRVQVVSGILRVVLSVFLGSWLGAQGAAWALMGGYVPYTILHVYYVQRNGPRIPFVQLGGGFALAAAMMGAVVYFLMPHVHLFVTILSGVVVYGASVMLLRCFSKEDIDLFRRIWRPGLRAAE